MKKLFVCLLLGALTLPCMAYETQIGDGGSIKMLNDSTPAYSLKILDEGFAGYSAGTVLPTFCLEAKEEFRPGSTYYGVINNGAIYGGPDWKDGVFENGFFKDYNSSVDKIDERTAYLYTQYYNDYLAGDRSDWNEGSLQQAIHYIEAENNWWDLSYTAKKYVSMADDAVDQGLWSGLGNMRSINLWTCAQGVGNWCSRVQDQLIMVSSPVPAPGALLLAGMGTALVGFLRRRNRDQ